MNLQTFAVFVQIVEKGSLAAAGRELGLSPTTVSERLAALESHYNVTLLHRTTRAISLTEEGRVLIEGARTVLAEAENLDMRIRLGASTLSGSIRISAPIELGRTIIAPATDTFLAANPAVSVELLLSDGYVNIVDEGIDLAVRFGHLADSTLRVRSLGQNQRVVCASPDYIAEHGAPGSPSELDQHNCLTMRFGAHLDNLWHFRVAGAEQQVVVRGNRVANDGELVHAWCLQGHGIALKSQLNVGPDLESGALVALLADYAPAPTPVQMIFPPGRMPPKRARALAEVISAAFK